MTYTAKEKDFLKEKKNNWKFIIVRILVEKLQSQHLICEKWAQMQKKIQRQTKIQYPRVTYEDSEAKKTGMREPQCKVQ